METLALDMAIPLLFLGLGIMVDSKEEQHPRPGARAGGMRTAGILCVALMIISAIPDSPFWSSPPGFLILLLFLVAIGVRQAIRSRRVEPV